MRQLLRNRVLGSAIFLSALAGATSWAKSSSPVIGRWDFSVTTPSGVGANWLGVSEKAGKLEVWFQPTGGHVFEVKDPKLSGSHLEFTASEATANRPAVIWTLDASGSTISGTIKRGENTTPVSGVRAPNLKRKAPKAWTTPEPLFNGKDLAGWEPIGDPSKSHWIVKDGELVNEAHGANLRTTKTFEDFKLHFEVNCPDEANSGFYLRGRYELQLEYEKEGTEPPERSMGAIYGRLAPSQKFPRTPGKWDTFDVTLVGNTITIARNGITTVDHKEIEGITGGAMNANEGEPGPFYIQGDHTGGLKFRNITVSEPKK